MIRYIFFSLIVSVSLYANPYKELDTDIKLNLMINYFLNQELKQIVPKAPVKEVLKDDGLSLEPIKYEKYYNYIQRIKAIQESRKAEQKNIDEKYLEKVSFYNAKLKVLKRFYNKKKNLNKLLKNNINKAFQVVYGKPQFKNLSYDEKTNIIYGILHIEPIYDVDKFKDKKIKIKLTQKEADILLNIYQTLLVKIELNYNNDTLYFTNIQFQMGEKNYKADFVDKINKKIKLKIKINDDIFRLIKIKG